MQGGFWKQLGHDLEAPIEARGFGTGWFSGFFGLLLAGVGLSFVAALRWPEWFAMPELAALRDWGSFRLVVHLTLLTAYALALLSLLLRSRKAMGTAALVVALTATILGGSAVQPQETRAWGIFFGVDFLVLTVMAGALPTPFCDRIFAIRSDGCAPTLNQYLIRSRFRFKRAGSLCGSSGLYVPSFSR